MVVVISYEEQTPVDQNGHVVVDIGSVSGTLTGGQVPITGPITGSTAFGIITTAPLGANGVFTSGTFVDSTKPILRGEVYSDQAGSLQLQVLLNTIWYNSGASIAVAAAVEQHFKMDIGVSGTSYRLVYTNGATAQTVFNLYFNISSL